MIILQTWKEKKMLNRLLQNRKLKKSVSTHTSVSAMAHLIRYPPRDPDVIRRRLDSSTDSLVAVENRVFGRKKTLRKMTASLRVLMTRCIRMFTNLAGDYNVRSRAADQAEDFVELLGVAMLSKGKKNHCPKKLYEKLALITAVYLSELRAFHTTVVAEARAAAVAEQLRNRLRIR